MGEVVGIDLGTTNCCVAHLDAEGKPQVIFDEATEQGLASSVIPSFVAVSEAGGTYVGQTARRDSVEHPDRVIYAAKRLMGRAFTSDVVKTMRSMVPYEIVAGGDGKALIEVGSTRLSPEDVAAELLTYLRQLASGTLNAPVTDAVITVPAHFNSRQRAATKHAAERAGLTVLRLINEPTAAALMFGHGRRSVERTVAVYDLGGGTFDISILEIGEGVYEVLATGGDTFLGGEDFDNRIVTHLIRRDIIQERNEPIDRISMLRLRQAAEVAKIQLSSQESAEIRLRSFLGKDEYRVTITRAELEQITKDIIDSTIGICAGAIKDAGLQLEDVEELILVGGQTRMPYIRKTVQDFFKRWPNVDFNPDEVVAMGAAIHAARLASGDTSQDLLLDVTPLTLGIASVSDTFSPVLGRNSKVPCSVTRTFSTVRDNQERVKLVVLQGESNRASQNVLLGELSLSGIRKAPRMQPKIDVTFRLDSNGMLHVSAKDRDTGEHADVTLRSFVEGERAGDEADVGDQAPATVED